MLIHSLGAALNQGYPYGMKFGLHATILTTFFTFFAMIISTVFSGLVMAQMLKKPTSIQIDSVQDLFEAGKDLKVIVVSQSYMQDLVETSPSLKPLQGIYVISSFII